ncbi:MAG: ABC transporter substrate-binding protein [Chloroflexi bacterium]|nr:ABC transporter substrate-binding protein [Chloroflexota bacterium]
MAQRLVTRRRFLILSGGLAAVGLAACSQPAAPAATTAPAPAKTSAPAPAATTAPAPAATTAPGPAATQAPAAAAAKKSLTAGFIAEQMQLDPHLLTAQTDQYTQHAVFNGLTAWDKEIKAQPDLAESWTNPDPKTWLFNLRQGVKFHNGREMVADDVKFSIDRIIQTGSKGKYAAYIVDVASVDVVSKYQVKINLKASSAPLLDNLTYCSIMPPEASDGDKQSKQPIGAGPYKFVERVPNRYIKFVKNPDYWRKPQNYPDELTFVPALEEATALANLKAGTIDYLDQIALKYATELESSPDIKLIDPYPGSASYTWTLMKNTAKPFDNVNMRMAVSYAIDRAAILRAVYYGHGEAHWNVFPMKHWAYAADIKGPEFNVDQAKKYLDAAKYGGEEIPYDIFTIQEYPQMAQLIQAMFKNVGLNVKIVQHEFAVWIQKVYQQHDFQLAQTSVAREWDADGLCVSCLYTKGSNNPGEYSSKDMDAAFDKGRQATSLDERKAAYKEVQRLYAQDQPHVKAVHRNIPGAYQAKKIKTINRSPSYMVYWRDLEMS